MEWVVPTDNSIDSENTPVPACAVGFVIGGVTACALTGMLCGSFCLLYVS